MEEIEV